MAKTVGPLFSIESRGKMGPLVVNTSRGNKYTKSKIAPAQPRTARQVTIRALALSFVRGWAALTAGQMLAWRDYADAHKESDWTGTQRRLSGINWYVRCNTRLADALESTIDDPPEDPAPGNVTGFDAAEAAGDLTVAWTDPTAAGDYIDVWVDGPHSAGRLGSPARATHHSYLDTDTATPAVLIASAQPGTYDIYARVLDASTGLVSQFVTDSVIV